MKSIWVICFFLLSVNGFAGFFESKEVGGKIYVYCKRDEKRYEILAEIGRKYGIDLERVEKLNKDSEALHIIFDAYLIPLKFFPKDYIVFQTLDLDQVPLNRGYLEKLEGAAAIWDSSWENIGRYSLFCEQYVYFSQENLETLFLSCLIPKQFLSDYRKVLKYSNSNDTDISSHLPVLFAHTVIKKPSLLIEAGVRSGESTRAFQLALSSTESDLIGVDIDPGSELVYREIDRAQFVCLSDLHFRAWWDISRYKNEQADIIFIDTSHYYEHTFQEMQTFLPLLKSGGFFAFHDTHMCPMAGHVYKRMNNTYGSGWNNQSGVARAIQDFFSISFDEEKQFEMQFIWNGFSCYLLHYPYCNGLTLVKIFKVGV